MNVRARQEMECRIALTAIRSILATGYFITVNDGEEEVVKYSRDPKVIAEAMMSTDEDRLIFFRKEGDRGYRQIGWVSLIYGNDGYDVISDYLANKETEEVLKEAELLADQLSEGSNYSNASKVMKEVFATFSFPELATA